MIESLEDLRLHIHQALGEKVHDSRLRLGELTIDLEREGLPDACRWLRDDPACAFEQLVDLCGMDYLEYGDGTWQGPRFAVVYHLLSVSRNHRLRVRVFLDDDIPIVPSVTEVWNCADWFEREAFDLFGMVFEGHPDLRRILTDYGFVGHPFRKDFPLVGLVEMRYDPDKKRVVYEPTRTEDRDLVPRVIREDEESHYHGRNQ